MTLNLVLSAIAAPGRVLNLLVTVLTIEFPAVNAGGCCLIIRQIEAYNTLQINLNIIHLTFLQDNPLKTLNYTRFINLKRSMDFRH